MNACRPQECGKKGAAEALHAVRRMTRVRLKPALLRGTNVTAQIESPKQRRCSPCPRTSRLRRQCRVAHERALLQHVPPRRVNRDTAPAANRPRRHLLPERGRHHERGIGEKTLTSSVVKWTFAKSSEASNAYPAAPGADGQRTAGGAERTTGRRTQSCPESGNADGSTRTSDPRATTRRACGMRAIARQSMRDPAGASFQIQPGSRTSARAARRRGLPSRTAARSGAPRSRPRRHTQRTGHRGPLDGGSDRGDRRRLPASAGPRPRRRRSPAAARGGSRHRLRRRPALEQARDLGQDPSPRGCPGSPRHTGHTAPCARGRSRIARYASPSQMLRRWSPSLKIRRCRERPGTQQGRTTPVGRDVDAVPEELAVPDASREARVVGRRPWRRDRVGLRRAQRRAAPRRARARPRRRGRQRAAWRAAGSSLTDAPPRGPRRTPSRHRDGPVQKLRSAATATAIATITWSSGATMTGTPSSRRGRARVPIHSFARST